jgi:chemotaxis protein methyltransferase WspC
LIYFDSENQARATRALARILDPAGLLFVGPSETNLVAKHGFVPLKAPMAFAFQTGVAGASHRRTRAPIVPASRKPEAAIEPSTTKRHLARPSPETRPSSEAAFAAIRQLADAGNLAEAAQRCEDYLRGGDAAAEAFHLLGVIRDADGKVGEAEACYRRALYLDPDHEEALIHLRFLLERIGDSTGAKVVGERMQRLERAGRR